MLIIESGAYTFIHKKSKEHEHPYCSAFIKDKVLGYNPSQLFLQVIHICPAKLLAQWKISITGQS
jgi:hypothetical protein